MASRTTRRRPAAAGRILATGLSTSAFFGSVAAIARHEQVADAAAPAAVAPMPGPPATTAPVAPATPSIVELHRTVYVDEAGNPVPAPDATLPVVIAVPTREAAAQTTSVAPSPEAGPAPVAPRASSVVTTVATGAAGGTTPAATTPAQTAPPQTAPPQTAPPQTAPPETAPPATQPPAPAPTAPSCSGSSC